MDLKEALQVIHDALPEQALSYDLHMSGYGASVHFVATDRSYNLIDVYGVGCDIEDAWREACKQLEPPMTAPKTESLDQGEG